LFVLASESTKTNPTEGVIIASHSLAFGLDVVLRSIGVIGGCVGALFSASDSGAFSRLSFVGLVLGFEDFVLITESKGLMLGVGDVTEFRTLAWVEGLEATRMLVGALDGDLLRLEEAPALIVTYLFGHFTLSIKFVPSLNDHLFLLSLWVSLERKRGSVELHPPPGMVNI
jgi:hypothetical protein